MKTGYRRCVSLYVPMLDITVRTSRKKLLSEGMSINQIAQYSADVHENIHREMHAFIAKCRDSVLLQVGGATLNTQSHIGGSLECIFFGFIGKDAYGEEIKKRSQGLCIEMCLEEQEDFPTPFCYVFLSEQDRTLVAHQLPTPPLSDRNRARLYSLLDRESVVYFVSFMFKMEEMTKEALAVLRKKKERGFCFILNLSTPEIIRAYTKEVLHAAGSCDFLLGNREEYAELCRAARPGRACSFEETLGYLDGLGVSYAITDGPGEVVGRLAGAQLVCVEPPRIGGDVNTNGAGDAFAAGFIAGLNCCSGMEELIGNGIKYSQRHIRAGSRMPPTDAPHFL